MKSTETHKPIRLLPVIIALTLVLAMLPVHASKADTLPPAPGKIYSGIDVSYYQGDIDFERVRDAGVEMVYIRSSSGSDFKDPQFDANYEKAHEAGLIIGVYHSLTAETEDEAVNQARFFSDCVGDRSVDCKFAMDYNAPDGLSNDTLNRNALAFLNTLMDEYGKEALVYSSASTAQDVWSEDIAKLVPLWVAEYGPDEPKANGKWESYAGFQYSETGRVDGIEGDVDLDRFTEAMLLTKTPPEPETPETKLIEITVVRGDNLTRLAREYGTTVSELVRLNAIKNPDLIFIGQKLIVRTAYDREGSEFTEYTVQRGNTLWGIAKRFGTTVAHLAEINGIKNPDLIFPGQVIKLS